MALDPWTYAKPTSEHSQQVALLMWANMACRFGLLIADDPNSYTVAGFALSQFNNAGQLGYKHFSAPVPQLKWLHAIHNQGHGDAIRGGKARAEGVKAGVADLFLPVPMVRGEGYNFVAPDNKYGLYIEMKVGSNKPSDKQLDFQVDMRAAGYACEVAYSWLEARQKILDYLSL